MKVIFLDMDGVLNSIKYYNKRRMDREINGPFCDRYGNEKLPRHAMEIDPEAMALLKEFVEPNNITLVISSTWRKLFSVEQMKELFALRGWDNAPIIGKTQSYNSSYCRGHEINGWLSENPDVEKFAIIDDDSDMTEDQKRNNFVHTRHATGLEQEHIEELKTILL